MTATGESQGGYLGNESLAGTQGPRREKRVTKSAGGDASLSLSPFGASPKIFRLSWKFNKWERALKRRDGKVNVTSEIATS